MRGPLNGWPIVGWAALAIALMIAAIAAVAGTDEQGIRMMIRATARTSVVLFSAAFVASSLRRVWPSRATRWLLANRRQLGVSFAVSHYVHLLAIFALYHWSLATYLDATPMIATIFGGLAYVFLTLMTITSFDATARWLGPRAWRRLHTVGAYWIWFIFAQSYVPRAVVDSGYYWLLAVLILGALTIRLAAPALARRRGTTETRVQAVGL